MSTGTPNMRPSRTLIAKKFGMSTQSSASSRTSGPRVQRIRFLASDMHRALLRTRLIGPGNQMHDLPLADLILIERGDLLSVTQDDDTVRDVDDFFKLGADE